MAGIGEYVHAYAKNYITHGTSRYDGKGYNGLSEIQNAVSLKRASAKGLYNKEDLALIKSGIEAAIRIDTTAFNSELQEATATYLKTVVDPKYYNLNQAGATAIAKGGDAKNLGALLNGKFEIAKIRAQKDSEAGRYAASLLKKIEECYDALALIGTVAGEGACSSKSVGNKVKKLQSNLEVASDLISKIATLSRRRKLGYSNTSFSGERLLSFQYENREGC